MTTGKINWIYFEKQLMSLAPENNMFLFDGVQSIKSDCGNDYDYYYNRGYRMSSASASHYQEICKNQGIVEAYKEMKYDFSIDY